MEDETPAGEIKRVSFRADEETVEHLDDLIWENKVAGNVDRDSSRSELLREKMDELIAELEGNSTETKAIAAD